MDTEAKREEKREELVGRETDSLIMLGSGYDMSLLGQAELILISTTGEWTKVW